MLVLFYLVDIIEIICTKGKLSIFVPEKLFGNVDIDRKPVKKFSYTRCLITCQLFYFILFGDQTQQQLQQRCPPTLLPSVKNYMIVRTAESASLTTSDGIVPRRIIRRTKAIPTVCTKLSAITSGRSSGSDVYAILTTDK